MESVASIKEYILVVVGVCTLLSIGATWVGFYVLTKFRLDRLDKVVFGNGKNGLIGDVNEHESRLDVLEDRVPVRRAARARVDEHYGAKGCAAFLSAARFPSRRNSTIDILHGLWYYLGVEDVIVCLE